MIVLLASVNAFKGEKFLLSVSTFTGSNELTWTRDGVIVICNHDYLKLITFFSNHKVICNRGFL